MIPAARRPGQPLAALVLVIGGWALARLAMWQAPLAFAEPLPRIDLPVRPALAAGGGIATPRTRSLASSPGAHQPPPLAPADRTAITTTAWSGPLALALTASSASDLLAPAPTDRPGIVQAGSDRARLALPATLPPRPLDPAAPGLATLARWSGDGWFLFRAGSAGALATAPGTGRYGASQAGAVLRYRLSSDERRPALSARTSTALADGAERELALGASARPIAAVPVRAQVELRAAQVGGRLRLRPAAFAVSELRPFDLPGKVRVQAYLQAGYVAGDFATPFAGGDLRIDRPLADVGGARLRVGGGAWGGAQKDAAALDIGPGATLETRFGGVPAALSLDYRLRVAGTAEPGSGLALTLATGF